VVLDFLHGGFGIERVPDGAELVHARHVRDGLSRVFRVARESKGFGTVEGDGGADLAKGVGGCALESRLLRCLCLRILGLGRGYSESLASHSPSTNPSSRAERQVTRSRRFRPASAEPSNPRL